MSHDTYTGGEDFQFMDHIAYPTHFLQLDAYGDLMCNGVLWTQTVLSKSLDLYSQRSVIFGATLNMYASRAPFSKLEILYQFLGQSGIDENVLIRLIRENARGLPEGITEKSVRKYWRNIGHDSSHLLSSISRQHQIERDYDIPIETLLPNQSITIDCFDAQFSKVKNSAGRLETVQALNGHLKVLLSVDTKSGSVRLYTCKSIKDPQFILERVVDDYGSLLEVWADKSFVTVESLAMCKRKQVNVHQFVPGQHNVYGGRVEGIGRWVKEGAQTCWNRVLEVVALKDITLLQAKKLWRHCWIFAVQVLNLRGSLHDPSIMRFFFVYGRHFSLVNDCMMPFMTPLIIYKLNPTDTGRGAKAFYLSRSETVGTGIVVYDPVTESTSVVSPFKVSTHDHNKGTPAQLSTVARELHGQFHGDVGGGDAITAIPSVVTPSTAGGGDRYTQMLDDTEIEDTPTPKKKIINKVTVAEAKRKMMDAAAKKKVEKDAQDASDRDQRQMDRKKVADLAIEAQRVLLDEDNRQRERANAFNDQYLSRLRQEQDSSQPDVGQSVPNTLPATIEEATANFRTRIKSIRSHRDETISRERTGLRSQATVDKRQSFQPVLGCRSDDDFESDTNDLIRMAVNDVQSNYAFITDLVLAGQSAGDFTGITPGIPSVFDSDPDGVHDREDREVMAAFARHQIMCILSEEMEFSEHRMYLEDLIGDYDVRNEAQEIAEAVEEAKLDTLDPNLRPPKPAVPGPSTRKSSELWIKALRREVDKLIAYDVMIELPKDPITGLYIRPHDAIIQRLIEVAEYKWKKDPDTGLMRWLECIRIVVDGSKDLRPDSFYALTPDRTILFVILAVVATLGHPSSTADVERAYLNAVSIDKNLVVLAGSHMFPLAAQNLLIKALYGSKAGALGWEKHIDAIMEGLGYERMAIARGVYVKFHQETGDIIRAYRHSDDFYLTCADQLVHHSEGELIRSKIGMYPFIVPYAVLGLECERRHHLTGDIDPLGKLVLVR